MFWPLDAFRCGSLARGGAHIGRYHGATKSILTKLFSTMHLCIEMKSKRALKIDRRADVVVNGLARDGNGREIIRWLAKASHYET